MTTNQQKTKARSSKATEIDIAHRSARHAVNELARIEGGGILDDERLTGIRSEFLHAALLITKAMDDDDVLGCATEALQDVERYGPGYPT